MNQFKFIILNAVFTLAIVFSTFAYAQRSDQPFNIAQRLLSITQALPIVAEVVVPIDGEEITASVPMTLNVALQVDLASPSIRSIETVASVGEGAVVDTGTGPVVAMGESAVDEQLQQVINALKNQPVEDDADEQIIGAGDLSNYEDWTPEEVVDVYGYIESNTVWKTGNVYVIREAVLVTEGQTLLIEPGVVIKVASESNRGKPLLSVHGTLLAIGTEEEPIVFTSLSDDHIGGDTDDNGDASFQRWSAIIFNEGSDESILNHVRVRSAGNTTIYNNNRVNAAIIIDSASPTLENVTVSWSGGHGIYVQERSEPFIANSSSVGNNGFAIHTHPAWPPAVQNVKFSGNQGDGLAFYDGTIENETIWSFTEYPIIIDGKISVARGALLKINEGVVAKAMYNNYKHLDVNGTLLAQGTKQKPIIFTSIRDDGIRGDTNNDKNASSPKPRDWGGIFLREGSDASVFNHTSIRYAGEYIYGNIAALRVYNSSPTFDTLDIRNAGDIEIECSGSAKPRLINSEGIDSQGCR